MDVISFSIDDYYKTQKEIRNVKKINGYFELEEFTGTHDASLPIQTFENTKKIFQTNFIPTFDKSTDKKKE